MGDEAAFFMNGRVNNQNVREYAPIHNLPPFNFDVNMSREKISLWIGLCGNGTLIEPCFFDGNLNGEWYLEMIDNKIVLQLQERFEQQEGGVFRRLWWAHDGAPPHRRIIVRNRLRHPFNMRVIALNHEIEWPIRSPDLTPCDFYFVGAS